MIYLDSSALVKLVITEPESAGLSHWLAGRPNLIRLSSPLARVEVARAVWRADPGALPVCYRIMRRIRDRRSCDEASFDGDVGSPARQSRKVVVRGLVLLHQNNNACHAIL